MKSEFMHIALSPRYSYCSKPIYCKQTRNMKYFTLYFLQDFSPKISTWRRVLRDEKVKAFWGKSNANQE